MILLNELLVLPDKCVLCARVAHGLLWVLLAPPLLLLVLPLLLLDGDAGGSDIIIEMGIAS
jgi:hypothetical protein